MASAQLHLARPFAGAVTTAARAMRHGSVRSTPPDEFRHSPSPRVASNPFPQTDSPPIAACRAVGIARLPSAILRSGETVDGEVVLSWGPRVE